MQSAFRKEIFVYRSDVVDKSMWSPNHSDSMLESGCIGPSPGYPFVESNTSLYYIATFDTLVERLIEALVGMLVENAKDAISQTTGRWWESWYT